MPQVGSLSVAFVSTLVRALWFLWGGQRILCYVERFRDGFLSGLFSDIKLVIFEFWNMAERRFRLIKARACRMAT